MASRISQVSCIFGRPVALRAGRWDLSQDQSTSQKSVDYTFLILNNLPSYPFKCSLNLLRAQFLGSGISSLWASSPCSDNLGGVSLGCNSKATRLDPVVAPPPTRRASFGTLL